jgi:hypothetical protein
MNWGGTCTGERDDELKGVGIIRFDGLTKTKGATQAK